jgi:hypothetical protein
MPDQPPAPATERAHPRWVWPVTLLLLALIVVGAGLWLAKQTLDVPARVVDKTGEAVKAAGAQAIEVAKAFRSGQLRQEFSSRAVELGGTTKLQVATLKQYEVFHDEKSGAVAWDLIQLPKVVVQAQAPVEYSYSVDLADGWEFRQEDRVLTVIPPPLEPNTPALDVSALKFYTLEGSLWPGETEVRDRLRESVTGRLNHRARSNIDLVREVARRQISEFVDKWLTEKFADGREYKIKVVFPDELPPTPAEKAKE